jgi:hypothetical protein
MPNLDLKNKQFKVTDDKVKNYFGGNGSVSYEYMNKVKSELDNKQDKDANDTAALKWIEKNLKQEADAVDRPKRIIMQTDGQGDKKGGNAFKDTHTKDRDNANPTAVGIPKIHKGGVQRQIMTNKVYYESIDTEIDDIRYLIEYMDNNKKQL